MSKTDGTMIPTPDYSDEDNYPTEQINKRHSKDEDFCEKENLQDRLDAEGFILPKKLPNPCKESAERKNLHRELVFNKKLGIDVLNKKSELQKAMEKHRDKRTLKELDEEQKASLTPLQKAIEERATQLQEKEIKEDKSSINPENSDCEFLKLHAKFRSKIEAK